MGRRTGPGRPRRPRPHRPVQPGPRPPRPNPGEGWGESPSSNPRSSAELNLPCFVSRHRPTIQRNVGARRQQALRNMLQLLSLYFYTAQIVFSFDSKIDFADFDFDDFARTPQPKPNGKQDKVFPNEMSICVPQNHQRRRQPWGRQQPSVRAFSSSISKKKTLQTPYSNVGCVCRQTCHHEGQLCTPGVWSTSLAQKGPGGLAGPKAPSQPSPHSLTNSPLSPHAESVSSADLPGLGPPAILGPHPSGWTPLGLICSRSTPTCPWEVATWASDTAPQGGGVPSPLPRPKAAFGHLWQFLTAFGCFWAAFGGLLTTFGFGCLLWLLLVTFDQV